jgi:uncharacterized membrane protein HdeD (DUF308 family)
MATNFPYFLSDAADEVPNLRRNWGWVLGLGVAMVIVGVLALGSPVVATITTVEVFGILLMIGGVVEVVGAFRVGRAGAFVLHVLCGLLSLFLGAVITERPVLGAAGYTLVLALFFVASGLARMVFALAHRFSGWGWVLLNGAVNLLLGMIIWRSFPEAALEVIGIFVGIDLVFNGVAWVMLGLALRSIPAPAAESAPPAAPTPGEPAQAGA